MKTISIPPPVWNDVLPVVTREFEGNLSRYVRELFRGDLANRRTRKAA